MTIKNLIRTHACVALSILFILSGCGNRSERLKQTDSKEKRDTIALNTLSTNSHESNSKIDKVIFLLENSGSLKGYVNGDKDFKTSVTAMAHFPEFDETEKTFYFINGKDKKCKIDFIGNSPDILDNALKSQNYNQDYSDLTKMFEVALDSTRNNNITILITDGLYDVGESEVPIKALEKEVEKTQETFRKKLNDEDVETIIIKAYSDFNGTYCFASRTGSIAITQQRPYYIFIFGKRKLLNKLNEENFKNKIKGFTNLARFLKIEEKEIPFQAIIKNKIGDFRVDRNEKHRLIKAISDRNGLGFQFLIATDFSTLPYSDSYLQSSSNYSCTGSNFKVTNVTPIETNLHEDISFNPTHLITLYTDKTPYCELNVFLNNVVPDWIIQTNTDDESNITSNTTQTFGFMLLTNAISEAYSYKNKKKSITNFTFKITK